MASIELRRVTKRYRTGPAAVHDLSLQIADGELLVLVGPSGSGKSTVLRLIAGLEPSDEGQIVIGGQDVSAVPPQQRDLAMVFQNYALYPHKTVRGNLEFALRVRRVPASEIDARVRSAAATLGIDHLLDRKPAQLSGGQRQRVALGRAIVREPRAFLLDEPLSNLDPRLRVETRAELAMLHRRLSATMVYVTHDQEEAMTLGQRIAVMRGGRVEQIGAPLELFDRPANAFVAGFIGMPAMNLRTVRWQRTPSGIAVEAPGLSLVLDRAHALAGASGEALLGIRPHELTLAPAAGADADAAGIVEVVEPLGATTVVHLRVGKELMRVVVPAGERVTVGDGAGVRVRTDRVHFFDAGTAKRITPV